MAGKEKKIKNLEILNLEFAMESQGNIFCTFFAILGAAIVDFYAHLGWWLLLGAGLLLLDLRYGIKAAAVRGETIRFSRAWRRSINKCVDYLGWVTVAELLFRTFGASLGKPIFSMGVLMAIYLIELSSCLNNYLEYKGLPWRFEPWKWIKEKTGIGAMLRKRKS